VAAACPDHVWALGYQHDLTVDGPAALPQCHRRFTREALATWPRRSWNAEQTTGFLNELIMTTGRKPEHIRKHNSTVPRQYSPALDM
jgi:putative transposase